jgi:hypothetical protein
MLYRHETFLFWAFFGNTQPGAVPTFTITGTTTDLPLLNQQQSG